ncbi:MAG TPA: ABC transporter substrate-binding protein, partial [Candidatus Aquilonibacter sp.]
MVPFRRFLALVALLALTALAPVRASHAPRIVVLVPSFAQDVVALGARSQLVGVSRFSDDVPDAAKIPVVADFQSVDTERIVALGPDVVAGIPSQGLLVAPLRRAGIRVVLIPDDSYDDIFTDIRELGALI